jgi:hypothetical protein
MQVPGFELNIHILGHEALQNIFFCFSSVVNTANTSSSPLLIFSHQKPWEIQCETTFLIVVHFDEAGLQSSIYNNEPNTKPTKRLISPT